MPAVAWVKGYLHGWANQIAARYGHPVYIVGSALREEDVRDIDIVCVLPDDEFRNRYGGSYEDTTRLGPDDAEGTRLGPQSRWCRDVAKISSQCAKYHRGVNPDFKVQDESGAPKDVERVRIDTVELEGQ